MRPEAPKAVIAMNPGGVLPAPLQMIASSGRLSFNHSMTRARSTSADGALCDEKPR